MQESRNLEYSSQTFSGRYISNCSVNLQKLLYLNVWVYPFWWVTIAFYLNFKFFNLSLLTRYLATSILAASMVIEGIRIYLGYCGNLYNQVPELAGFWMLTILMQIPLTSFFAFNPHLDSTPMEVVLHATIYILLISQFVLGYSALKKASAHAKNIYLSRSTLTKN